MKPFIKILHLEDDPADAELVQAKLTKAGLSCRITLARTRDEFETVLGNGETDIILADYRLPMYDGMSAMHLANELQPDIPFIFVSGTMGEELAIEALTRGAIDYVLKQNLSRLPSAVQRALQEARNQRERKRTQEKLEEERSLLRCLIDSASDLIFIKDQDSIYRACNKASEAFIGMPESEQIGKTDNDFFDPEKAEEIRKADKQVIDEGKSLHIEEWVTARDGRRLLMDTIKTPYFDPEGKPLGLVGIGRDITEREMLEKDRLAHLRFFESLDKVNRAIQGADDLKEMMTDLLDIVLSIFDCDRAYLICPCDPDAKTWDYIIQRETNEYPGVIDLELPTISQVADTLRVLLDSESPVVFGPGSSYLMNGEVTEKFGVRSALAMAIYPKTGSPWQFGIQQCSHARVWTDEEKRLFQEIGRRIADGLTSMLISRDLQESELRYRSLVENVPDLISRFDTEQRFLYVNPSVIRAFDIPLELFVGKKPSELPPTGLQNQNEILEKKVREAIDTGNINRIEAEWPMREGDRCYEIVHVPEKDEKGTIVSVLGITRDITEHKRAEQERASHLDFFKNMDQINRAIQGAENIEQMMSDVLDVVLSIYDCDRAYLLYPCDPDSPTWVCPMERNKPEYPGALELNLNVPMDPQVSESFRVLLASDAPVGFGPGTPYALPESVSKQFGFKCFMAMAIYPKSGRPWQFGIHQCSHARIWTTEEKRLFQEIGRRLADALTSMLMSRDLRNNEEFLNKIVENIPDMIFVKDAETLKFVRLNQAGEKLLGYSRDELLGKSDYDFFPKEEADFFTDKDRVVLNTKDLLDIPEEKIRNRGNEERTLHTKKIPILNETGTPQYLLGISEDITERKRSEEKILRSDQRLRLHSEQSPLGFLEWDDNFHAVEWNTACEQIFGYTREEAIGRHAKDLILPIEVHELVDGIYQSLMNQTGGQHSINENVTKDGRIIICEWFNTTMIDKDGKAIGVASIVTDITDRKKAEEALALKNRINEIFLTFPGEEMYWEVLQVILELTESPYGIFAYIDEEGALVVPTLTGEVWEECQIPGKSIVFPHESWGDSIWGQVIRGKRSIYSNISFKVPDGHISIKKALGIPIIYQAEVIGHFLVANRETDYNDRDRELLEGIADLISPILYSRLQTERQEKLRNRSESEIKNLKNHLANIIDSMPSMLVGIDKNEIITQWNRQVETTTGILAAEAVGKPVKQMFPDLSPHIEAMMGEIKQRRTAVMEKLPVEKEEERRLYDLMLYPLLTNGTEGAVLRIEDVTEQARIQNLMIQTEKMMSLGGLAAGMAHEINNPLGIITQAAQNLERRIFSDLKANLETAGETGVDFDGVKAYFEKRQIPEFIGSIREASRRASRIIGNILKFSRGADSAMQPASLVSVIDQVLELAAGDYDLKKKYDFKSIEIIREYEPDLPMVPMVSVEMGQVVLNLLKNSAQAVSDNPSDRKPRIILRLRREERYVLLEVADNGHGMDENTRLRVFEPFYTTKAPGIGTGLGLSVAYMIVTQNHKGLMEVESTPGNGTCFRVRLPLG